MLYAKEIQGWCEQIYDMHGNCISQRFVAKDSEPIVRRVQLKEGELPQVGELEDEEVIEHPEDLAYLESIEKHCPMEMAPVPPPVPAAKRK
jgi:hypothetical protein